MRGPVTQATKAGFIEHYILPVLYPGGLTRDMSRLALGVLVILVNLLVYGSGATVGARIAAGRRLAARVPAVGPHAPCH